MTAETETAPFPLHPLAEETLAAMPDVTGRLTQAIDVPPFPRWAPWPEYDACVPVTEQACAALVTGWIAEARTRLHVAANDWLTGAPPVAEPVPPAENDGLTLTEEGHDDPSAASEGDAAAPDLPRPGEATSNTGPGQPTETALIPVAEDFTQAIPAVTDSTEGEVTS